MQKNMNQKVVFARLKRLVKGIGAELFFDTFFSMNGMLTRLGKGTFILINSRLSLTKQNFTIAHELAHYTLEHAGYSTDQMLFHSGKTTKKKSYIALEGEADILAYEIIQMVSGQANQREQSEHTQSYF